MFHQELLNVNLAFQLYFLMFQDIPLLTEPNVKHAMDSLLDASHAQLTQVLLLAKPVLMINFQLLEGQVVVHVVK